MENKTFKIKDGDMSDGFHTFDELYEHRVVLFIALCRKLRLESADWDIWCSLKHSDGSKYDGWFILGIWKEKEAQITYHLPEIYWSEVSDFAEVLDKAPEYDGHTPEDVIERLKKL